MTTTFKVLNVFSRDSYILFLIVAYCFGITVSLHADELEETRLLRQPTISDQQIAFIYGADLWISDFDGENVRRLTSTPAIESNPHFSPDGNWIAFTSNRSGVNAVYIMSKEGGTPKRLTWYPSSSYARGWTPDGQRVLYASSRHTAPRPYNRLWTVSVAGGPSDLLPAPWAFDGYYNTEADQIIIDRVSRWDVEWRAYRGGQNTALTILNLKDLTETKLPNERTTDTQPVWIGDDIYFLSDRDFTTNIWSYSVSSGAVKQLTTFKGTDVKWLSAGKGSLAYEHNGYLHLYDLRANTSRQLKINVFGDFPWSDTRWENVSSRVRSASVSPTGKRAIMEARGEIFTVPLEHGDPRNISKSSNAADRAPLWSPKGDSVAWFSDAGGEGYALYIASQDGMHDSRMISIGESKMAWEPTWSPDGKYIAFVDDDVRIKVLNVGSGKIRTADIGGHNLERGGLGICWSPDSKWLAYSKTASNGFRQIKVWSTEENSIKPITDKFADATSPAWDRDGKHLYFLASTNLALGSGWANTSAMSSDPSYGIYLVSLDKKEKSPFDPKSDEEEAEKSETEGNGDEGVKDKKKSKDKKKEKEDGKESEGDEHEKIEPVNIDFENIERRIVSLPMPVSNYRFVLGGTKGSFFIAESVPKSPGLKLLKYTLEDRESKEFVSNIRSASISSDGKKMLIRQGSGWKIIGTDNPPGDKVKSLKVNLRMQLDRGEEWNQIFEEAWRYERDYFYDPDMHGRDWQAVHEKYAPLIPFVKHRSDLSYVLDQVNGELSVGHSFVFGGDFPAVDTTWVGLLGADFKLESGYWQISRIYTTESWNPGLKAPLDRPGLKVEEGNYFVGVNGEELTGAQDPYKLLDGSKGHQSTIHINSKPGFEGSWEIIVTPIASENGLRQRAWVEDNRRKVDELSDGKLAYVWIPNTGGPGVVSFNRYFFAQQDKEGAVIDERFNGGGLLDDYMVDLMTRKLRAAITNEVPNGTPFRLPAGILGPKVLLINELAGSGGDFFPWVFRQQKAGPLIGTRTWGGLVKSSVHYALVDGGALTAPDNAVFDPINKKWIGENEGIPPDIEVHLDAISVSKGIDPQLERAVSEALKLLKKDGNVELIPPGFSTPALPDK